MIRENIQRNFGFLVHDVSRLLKAEFDRRGRELGLTRSQWWALTALYANEGCTQSELAVFMELEKATLGRLLDRLEHKNWVVRRPDPRDRRVNRLYLTDRVQALMLRLRDIAAGVRGDAIAGLTQAEHARFVDTLIKIKANLLSPDAKRAGNTVQTRALAGDD